MQYEADQNMVFNYLMVSGLAAATDMFEKNGAGMTGGKHVFDVLDFLLESMIFLLLKHQIIK
jgi:NhaP-type Na+/H+ or K+/H+ antiporter